MGPGCGSARPAGDLRGAAVRHEPEDAVRDRLTGLRDLVAGSADETLGTEAVLRSRGTPDEPRPTTVRGA